MNNEQNNIWNENLMEWAIPFSKMVGVTKQAKDNLFCANHRGQMLRTYGYTEAQTIKLEDLINA